MDLLTGNTKEKINATTTVISLSVDSNQMFMGKIIPVVSGGFGIDKRCMCDKTIAQIHNSETYHIRELINRNIARFKENIDFIDLKVIAHNDNNLFEKLGYSKMQISKAEHIYILSERGYAKLIKIMDTDLAWDIHDKLIDEYFTLRDEKKSNLPMTYRDAVAQLLESLDREEELKAQLDTSKDWYSIKRVASLNGVNWKTFDWRRLKNIGEQMGYQVKKIFDANYGEVNTYHKLVWENAYPEYEL